MGWYRKLIKVKIKLFTTGENDLKRKTKRGNDNSLILDIPEGFSIKDITEMLCGTTISNKIIFVNGVYKCSDYILKDNDEVVIIPPLAGG